MSVVKKIIQDNIERVKVDELLAGEYEQAGYGGITLTKTPLGTQINLFAMRPGRVIGKRGSAIKKASERLEFELGLPNPQITVVEVEVPELNPRIMAARIANALERGVHYRRALFWSLRRTMESGALGCEIVLRGKLRSDRSRYEKVSEGYIPKSGYPAQTEVKSAVIHVKQKKGTFGVTVTIVPPDAKFPDKISLEGLPVIEYPEEEIVLPEGVEPDLPEAEAETAEAEAAETPEAVTEAPAAEAEVAEMPEATAEATITETESVEAPEAAAETPTPEAQPETEAETPEAEVQPEPEVPVEEAVTEEPVVEEPDALPEEEKAEAEAQAVEPEEQAVQEPKAPAEDTIEEQPVEESEAPKAEEKAEEAPAEPEEPSPDVAEASPEEGEKESESQESPETPEETDAGEA